MKQLIVILLVIAGVNSVHSQSEKELEIEEMEQFILIQKAFGTKGSWHSFLMSALRSIHPTLK